MMVVYPMAMDYSALKINIHCYYSRASTGRSVELPGSGSAQRQVGVRVWPPSPGSMHDMAALDALRLFEGIDHRTLRVWIAADKGYAGRRRMITPAQEALPTAKWARMSRRRAGASTGRQAEKVDHFPIPSPGESSHHTAYRRSLHTFEQTITIALSLWRLQNHLLTTSIAYILKVIIKIIFRLQKYFQTRPK